MKIGTYIHYDEFNALHDRLNGEEDIPEEERLELVTRFGNEILDAIMSEKMHPNWHCTNCLSDFGAQGDMYSCPKCFTETMEYIGPPRIGHEIKPKKVTQLREAGRSQMTGGGGQQQNPMFKKCPEDHILEFKEERKGYFFHWCYNCEAWRARKDKQITSAEIPVA
ncbi:hypothetical protein LCGC14_0429950 [marine sediment metagenome]|uniref:Uncharacterized protein n=1 Tax=marine sediment metagenome TaxID=412755 RepID=A0A0F9SUK1_9ZZZZ